MTDPRTQVPTVKVWEAVRCQAHTSSGAPCKKWAIQGGFVCNTHGGSAPQVRAAANRRLMALAPRAVQVLADLLEHSESDIVRLRAATELLDRGIGKAVDVTLDITPQEAAEGPSPLALRIAAALDRLAPAEEPEIVDAEVIEDQADTPPDLGLPPSPHT